MNIGFEFEAAKPKVKSEDDAPYSESMRGSRKITSNPSTDQKKVRRLQQRKQAELNEYELEVEAGIRDWFNRFKTPENPMKDSGVFPDECPTCGGSGYDMNSFGNECRDCNGQGESFAPRNNPDVVVQRPSGEPARHGGTCMACNGSGQDYFGQNCRACRGSGHTAAKVTCQGPGCKNSTVNGKYCADCAKDSEWNDLSKTVEDGRKDFDKKAALDDHGGKCPLCDDPLPKGEGTVTCGGCGKDVDIQSKERTARRNGGSEFSYMNAISRHARRVLDTEEK